MTAETLKERIANAQKKIATKQGTIDKKLKLIEKKMQKLIQLGVADQDSTTMDDVRSTGNTEAMWLMCDIKYLKEDIQRGKREIAETEQTLAKYEKQLTGELEQEAVLREIPEVLKKLRDELVARWDAWDMERKARYWKDRREMEWGAFRKKYKYADTRFAEQSDEQIHKNNIRDAEFLILDLVRRVQAITGEITSWADIRATQGAQGFTVLNGIVMGKEGRAEIESILAGGYNIQRLHIRVLVKEYK